MKRRYLPLLLLAAGCAKEIHSEYAVPDGRSVNGTLVFGNLVRKLGHRVSYAPALYPRLKKEADVLCLFATKSSGLSPEEEQWLTDYLKQGKTAIVVLRDFDAAIPYWRFVLDNEGDRLTPADNALVRRRLSEAETEFRTQLLSSPAPEPRFARFKTMDDANGRHATKLRGPKWWNEGTVADGLDLVFYRRLGFPGGARPVLTAGWDTLVARQAVQSGTLWIVANGCFLLNLPLVHHEHRKLAADFVGQTSPKPAHWVIVRSSRVYSKDPRADSPSIARMLGTPPVGWIAAQLVMVGLCYSVYQLPIFGRPAPRPSRGLLRFGRHLEAVGALLARSRRPAVARQKIQRYWQEKP